MEDEVWGNQEFPQGHLRRMEAGREDEVWGNQELPQGYLRRMEVVLKVVLSISPSLGIRALERWRMENRWRIEKLSEVGSLRRMEDEVWEDEVFFFAICWFECLEKYKRHLFLAFQGF